MPNNQTELPEITVVRTDPETTRDGSNVSPCLLVAIKHTQEIYLPFIGYREVFVQSL